MADKSVSYEVHGAKELRKAARKVGAEAPKAIREANKKTASVVASEAKSNVSNVSGTLAGSVRPLGSQRSAVVAAGSARIKYAGVIHYGNPTKKGRLGVIRPQPFIHEAVRSEWDEIWRTYERLITEVAEQLSTGGFGNG